jgi:hypothetical protein
VAADVYRRGRLGFAPARKYAMPLADGSEGRIFAGVADILESAPKYHEEPKLVIRKAPHVSVTTVILPPRRGSVLMTDILHGFPLFECSFDR